MRSVPTIKIYSIVGNTPNTLSIWTNMEDSAYNFCEVNTTSVKGGIGFDSIRTIGGYDSIEKFIENDPQAYVFKYIASAEL